MNYNTEMYNDITSNFLDELKPEEIKFLKEILGDSEFKVEVDETNKEKIRSRVENLAKSRYKDNTATILENANTNTSLNKILNAAKCKLAADAVLKELNKIKTYEDLDDNKLKFLLNFCSSGNIANYYHLQSNDNFTSTTLEKIATVVSDKIPMFEQLNDSLNTRQEKLKEKLYDEDIISAQTNSKEAQEKVAKTLEAIETKKSQIVTEIEQFEANLLNAKKIKDDLAISAAQHDIDQKKAEMQVLLASQEKLGFIASKLNIRLPEALKVIKERYQAAAALIEAADLIKEADFIKWKSEVAKNEKKFLQIDAILEDLQDEISRCKQVINLAELATKAPERQLYAKKPVNAFIEILSLADIDNFNEKGEPYFFDEILSEKTQKPSANKDLRTRFGLEAHVILRGVDLASDEFKRSSYVAFTKDGKRDTNKQIAVETRVAHLKKIGQAPRAKIDYIVKGSLDQREKQLGALRFAKEILHLYNEGDKKNPIVIRAGKGQDPEVIKEQATLVYAAILMLTSPDPANSSDYVELPKDMLKIEVDGIDGPALLEWPWKRKEEFIKKYFSEDEVRESRKGFTDQYRRTRQAMLRNGEPSSVIAQVAASYDHGITPLSNNKPKP